MNALNGIRGKNIHEMLPTALCHSKAPKVLMQSDMPLGLRSSAKKGTFTCISSIQTNELKAHCTVRQQTIKFSPLCRLNYRSHDIENFDDV